MANAPNPQSLLPNPYSSESINKKFIFAYLPGGSTYIRGYQNCAECIKQLSNTLYKLVSNHSPSNLYSVIASVHWYKVFLSYLWQAPVNNIKSGIRIIWDAAAAEQHPAVNPADVKAMEDVVRVDVTE